MNNASSQSAPDNAGSLFVATKKVYARSVKGLFAKWRVALVWFTQIIYFGLPWLTWSGRPAVWINLEGERFYFFGLVLYPQDVIYLTAILIISAMALFLFTAVAGRQWCGYACPQTVYTEIYMWMERWVEGDRNVRMKLDSSPLSAKKFARKTAKQIMWVGFGLWSGLTLVGYFTPIRELLANFAHWNLGPWETFWIFFYAFATYGNAGYMREQVCKYMCPYARFQSAMFDHDTLIVTYDSARGEKRGPRSKKMDYKAQGLGDCVNCTLCVQVCPVGIDIRDGLQYECISCAACIDACDEVMDKMGYPRGLIRYSTQNGVEQGWTKRQILKRVLRPRVLVYTAILLTVTAGLIVSIALRTPFKVNIVRDRAALARIVDNGFIENIYRIQVMNASESPQTFHLKVDGLPGIAIATDQSVEVDATQSKWISMRLRVPYDAAPSGSHSVQVEISNPALGVVTEKSVFIMPR